MPSETDRASIASQISEIERSLTPASRKAIIAEVAMLLLAFPAIGGSDGDTQGARLDVYAAILSDLPIWAIRSACERLMRGKGGGKAGFAPAADVIHRLAEEATAPHRMMIAKLNRVLSAKPIGREMTRESRDRVATGLGDLAAKLRAQADETARKARA